MVFFIRLFCCIFFKHKIKYFEKEQIILEALFYQFYHKVLFFQEIFKILSPFSFMVDIM